MACHLNNSFTSFNFSQQELLDSSLLSPTQRQLIQNDIATVAEQIIGLVYNPANPLQFVQDDAHLKGQLAAFRFILERSEEAENAIKQSAVDAANGNYPNR